MKVRHKKRLVGNKRRGPAPNPFRVDPSRTGVLRRRWQAELSRRFARLRLAVADLVEREDAFGLRVPDRSVDGVFAGNVFCPTGPGGGIDPTCSPVSAGKSRSQSRREAIRREAALVQFSDQEAGGEVGRDDYDEIEARMSDSERRQMDAEVEQTRDSAVEEMVSDYQRQIQDDYREEDDQEEAEADIERRVDRYHERVEADYDTQEDRNILLQDFWREHSARYESVAAERTWHPDDEGDHVYKFSTAGGKEYFVRAVKKRQQFRGEPVEDVQFSDAEGGYGVTGAGSAFEVFSAVVPAIVAYIQHHDKELVTFTAKEESRRKLYDRLARTTAEVLPDYFAAALDVGGVRNYIVGKRELKEQLLAEIARLAGGAPAPEILVNSRVVVLRPRSDPSWWSVRGWRPVANADCGTGAGGFKPGNICAAGGVGKQPHEMTRFENGSMFAQYRMDVDLSKVRPRETKKDQVVIDEYASLLGQGSEPPPVVLLGNPDGTFDIDEGHYRYYAAKKAGRKTIRALVTPVDEYGVPQTHKAAVAEALAAGKHVPPEVLKDYPDLQPTANTRWRFHSSPAKLAAFTAWLRAQVKTRILDDADLWHAYVEEGFRKGAGRAFDDTEKARGRRRFAPGEGGLYAASREQFLRDTFAQPVAVERVQLLASRVLTDLHGVTEQMETVMVRTLVDGLTQGKGPREVARDLMKNVDGIGKARALLIARTEIIRAHSEGQLTAMENLGVESVGVAIEWQTAKGDDPRVCAACKPMDGVVLTIKEAHGLLPRHPACRCSWVPSIQQVPGQKATKSTIDAALRASVLAETRGRRASRWLGADAAIAAGRPESVLNVFCPTGKGGGVDATCSPGGGRRGMGLLGTGGADDPVRCGADVKLAARLLSQGKHIRLEQPDQVSTLLDRMDRMIKKAVKQGRQAPNFDLCKVSVPDTNLFCMDTLGIPRVKMPQMRGFPVPGTYAATKRVSRAGKVDLSRDFVEHLRSQGIGVEKTKVRASHLRASQSEIVGARVVQLMNEAEAGERDLRERPIFVTRDNYVVDGHHHWAAIVGVGYKHDKDLKVPVYRLDLEIGEALDKANAYAKQAGIAPKVGTTANRWRPVANVFCPTGEGGGIDPTCSPKDGGSVLKAEHRVPYEYQPRSGSKTPWKGKLPQEGDWRVDPELRTVEVARKVKVGDLLLGEPLAPFDPRTEDVERYAAWAKEGREIPPITVVVTASGKLKSLNNRRVMAAQKAGREELMAWIDTGKTLDQFTVNQRWRPVRNVFCPTGTGGGIDPTCSPAKGGGRAQIVTDINRMIEIQAAAFEKDIGGWNQEYTREGFIKNWKRTLRGKKADPEKAKVIADAVESAYAKYDIPQAPIFVRKATEDEQLQGENGHWGNGFMVIADDAAEERRYHSRQKGLAERKGTVKESYSDVLEGLVVHEFGHRHHGGNSKGRNEEMLRRAIFILSDRRKEIADRISDYASTNQFELVAEAYTMSRHPDFASLAKETKDLVEEVLRGGTVANRWRPIRNVFCPTGPGGGVDPTCSPAKGTVSVDDLAGAFARGMESGPDPLPAQYRRQYESTARKVFERMPAGARERFQRNVAGYAVHRNRALLSNGLEALYSAIKGKIKDGYVTEGAYARDTRTLWLDGDLGPDNRRVGTYAHEFGHAIDGPDFEISGSMPWRDAWQKEVVGRGGLSDYAKSSPSEGLAEFARLMYSGKVPAEKVASKFPGCVEVCRQWGILP